MARKSDLLTHGRRLNDLALALVESVHEAGGDDDDARRVFGDELLKKRLGLLVMGRLKLGQFPSETQAADLIPEGWAVVEDVEPSEFNISDLEFVSFLEGEEQYVAGEEMRKRSVALRGNLGLCDAKRLLAGQNEIPEDIRSKYIVLPGTVLRGSDRYLRVPFLYWHGGRWILIFFWLDYVWYGGYRFARRK